MKFIYICLFILCMKLRDAHSAKILAVLPLPTPSHFILYKTIFEELAARGHEVDVITPFPPMKNITNLNYIIVPDALEAYFQPLTLEELRALSVQGIMDLMLGADYNTCQLMFRLEELDKLRDSKKKYDVIFLEVFGTDCLFGYAHVFKAPVIAITSSVDLPWGASRIGNTDHPAYIPNYFRNFLPEMSLYERVANTITLVHSKLTHNGHIQLQDKEARIFFGDSLPHINDIVANSSLFMVNSHFSLNQARPSVPNFVEIAGLHIKEPKPLPKDLQEFIGNSKFIYFCLGSVATPETMKLDRLQNILDAFRELKHKIIWKVDKNNIPKELIVPENIYVDKWLPQLDVLCHPHILLFITHNGLLGTQEAVYCGVPMLSIPIFADQYLNAKNVENREIAKQINLDTISRQELKLTIKELIDNPKYKNNARQLSEAFKDRPRSPLEEAIYWTEYVIRHNGAPQLRSRSADLKWYQYYLIDVALVIVSVAAVISTVLYVVMRRIIRSIFRIRGNTKHKVA